MTDLELQKKFIQVSLRRFEITLGELLHVTKEHVSQVSWVKSRIAPVFAKSASLMPHNSFLST